MNFIKILFCRFFIPFPPEPSKHSSLSATSVSRSEMLCCGGYSRNRREDTIYLFRSVRGLSSFCIRPIRVVRRLWSSSSEMGSWDTDRENRSTSEVTITLIYFASTQESKYGRISDSPQERRIPLSAVSRQHPMERSGEGPFLRPISSLMTQKQG
jgi:hypothetical protein